LGIFKEKDFEERRNASLDARKAMVQKFRSAAEGDASAAQVRAAERRAVADDRLARAAERKNAKQAELVREKQEALDRAEAELAAEAERLDTIAAEKVKRVEAELSLAARVVADESVRKAARDAKYAARKARKN
jgi:Family of unknown function (DUF6481)